LNKQEHIAYWVETAEKDWAAIQRIYTARAYLHALFFAHLVLEKLLKAHWVKDNESNTPPKIHNLVVLCRKTKVSLEEKDIIFLDRMNDLQLEGRYPEYLEKVYKIYKRKETALILEQVDTIRKCLLKNLQ
jgi:HEPN domain-containing protein